MSRPRDRPPGFSLIETLIATTIVIVALSGLAQLLVIATATNQRSKSTTIATILAQEKMEDLITPDRDVEGGCDFLDGRGRLLGEGVAPPPGTVYVRRWSVEPLPSAPNRAFVLEVVVTRLPDITAVGGNRLPADTRIVGVRTRKAS